MPIKPPENSPKLDGVIKVKIVCLEYNYCCRVVNKSVHRWKRSVVGVFSNNGMRRMNLKIAKNLAH